MSGLDRILLHTAVSVRTEASGPVIEGEREEDVVESAPFACVVFPAGTREAGRDGRRLDQPMMMHNGVDSVGDLIGLRAEDRIILRAAPGLSETDLGEYQVDGDPLPLGRPGSVPVGYQVNLRRVLGE